VLKQGLGVFLLVVGHRKDGVPVCGSDRIGIEPPVRRRNHDAASARAPGLDRRIEVSDASDERVEGSYFAVANGFLGLDGREGLPDAGVDNIELRHRYQPRWQGPSRPVKRLL